MGSISQVLLIRALQVTAAQQLINMGNPVFTFCRVISIAWGKGPSTIHVRDYVFFHTDSAYNNALQ